jgi:hypothetical protein
MDQAHGGVDLGVGLGRKPEDDIALDVDSALGQPAHDGAGHVRGDPFVDVGQHPVAA